MKPKIKPTFKYIVGIFLFLILFQNFDYYDWKNLKDQVGDLDQNTRIAVPDSGSDLNSVASNWLEKEHRVLFGNWEQKWVDQLNEKLIYNNPNSSNDLTEKLNEANSEKNYRNIASIQEPSKKQILKFKKINELNYQLDEQSDLNCLVSTDANVNLIYAKKLMANTQMKIKFSSKQNENAHFGFEHSW